MTSRNILETSALSPIKCRRKRVKMDVKAGYIERPGTKVTLSEQPDVDLAEVCCG